MKNGVKNGNLTKFSSTNQPSSKAKKEGWKRRSRIMKVMEQIDNYLEMSYKEFLEVDESELTVGELVNYRFTESLLNKSSMRKFWIDKNIPSNKFNFSEDNLKVREFDGYVVEIINKIEDVDSNQIEN